ncbi:MAG: bifunctional demethylmenaquinone methyltransferase/2-methoxy-6-polyprenyl-1,4-benzoquinol methylase UbiE [Proteobacteria bacterium]|nr:bifunctional demethylmenaquinone methyltransferase/2-methoxy-6-polyprenyl-1,4-benzoquinol methylase UbiE [Pseudomonadota bacterium]
MAGLSSPSGSRWCKSGRGAFGFYLASNWRAFPLSQTHFGFETVDEEDKAHRVAAVFDSVANRYDLMNDVMSAGMHRLWKRFAVEQSGVRPGHKVLDIAGGSGDLARLFMDRMQGQGQVVLTDINESMLKVGRDRLINDGRVPFIVRCDGEKLPFPDRYFDCVSVAFGLRNMTHKNQALDEMHRVLRMGGKLIVLEFSHIAKSLSRLYDLYSFKVIPRMGQWLVKDAESYRYLAESIRMHPDQEALKQMITDAGFSRAGYFNLALGAVAVHYGWRMI